MRISLDRRGSISLTDQLKAQVRHQILSGRLAAGMRLPPVRTLAGFLRVNRNTVARAYGELQAEGVLQARPGRGTHVVWAPASPRASQVLTAQIDRLLGTAAAVGVDLDDLLAAITVRAGHRRVHARPRVGFVECNPVDLTYFTRLLRAAVDVPVVPMLLADLPARLADVDLVATTFFHAEDVRRRCRGIEVVGLMALPEFRSLEEIARLPRTRRVALVCATKEGVTSKAQSLAAVGLRTPRLQTATLGDPVELAEILAQSEVVLAAPRVIDRMRPLIPQDVRVVPFASVLSDGAVALLRERIAAWRARHTAGKEARRPGAPPQRLLEIPA